MAVSVARVAVHAGGKRRAGGRRVQAITVPGERESRGPTHVRPAGACTGQKRPTESGSPTGQKRPSP